MVERRSVFISSTSRDLLAYREAVAKVILRLGMYPIDMATFNPTDANALQLCYDKACEAEIFIGIYAHRYGYAPDHTITYTSETGQTFTGDGETGITHFEYLWALERHLPMLLFVVGDTDAEGKPLAWPPNHVEDEPGQSRLKQFKTLIMSQHVVGFFHSPDHLATQIATGLANLQSRIAATTGPSQRADFYKHIQLPPNYVPRSDLLDELRLALLGDETVALTSAIKSATALHGMGGIGKSVMARALCDDTAVRAAYPDGILWATLGQDPNLIAKLREWVEALGGTISETAPTVDSLKAKLADLLQTRSCLLIVDDVWQKKHAEVFRVGGKNTRFLLTTRDAEIARSLGAAVQPIPTMSETEALTLLREWADGTLQETDTVLLTKIVNKLGRLPLALKLAGAQLQKKAPDKWLERFDARKLASKRPEDIHDSLEQTFGLSLETLEATERQLYAVLSIFKEDEPIREVAIQRLWGALDDLDEEDVGDFLDDLAARALLEVVGDAFPRAALLHDLLRDFMHAELDNPQSAHQKLLDAYRTTQAEEGWHTAPDDGYLYNHLVYHLVALNDYSSIQALFDNQNWMNVRVPADDYRYAGYLEDLEVYWIYVAERAQGNIEAKIIDVKNDLAELRCALIRTSINSLATNYTKGLIYAAVEHKFWSFNRAISVINLIADYRYRFFRELVKSSRLTRSQKGELLNQLGLDIENLFTIAQDDSGFIFKPGWILNETDIALLPYLNVQQLHNLLVFVTSIYDRESYYLWLSDFNMLPSKNERDKQLETIQSIVRSMGAFLPKEILEQEIQKLSEHKCREDIVHALRHPSVLVFAPAFDQSETRRLLEEALQIRDSEALFHFLVGISTYCEKAVANKLIEFVLAETNQLTQHTDTYVLDQLFKTQDQITQQKILDFYLRTADVRGEFKHQTTFTDIPLPEGLIDYTCDLICDLKDDQQVVAALKWIASYIKPMHSLKIMDRIDKFESEETKFLVVEIFLNSDRSDLVIAKNYTVMKQIIFKFKIARWQIPGYIDLIYYLANLVNTNQVEMDLFYQEAQDLFEKAISQLPSLKTEELYKDKVSVKAVQFLCTISSYLTIEEIGFVTEVLNEYFFQRSSLLSYNSLRRKQADMELISIARKLDLSMLEQLCQLVDLAFSEHRITSGYIQWFYGEIDKEIENSKSEKRLFIQAQRQKYEMLSDEGKIEEDLLFGYEEDTVLTRRRDYEFFPSKEEKGDDLDSSSFGYDDDEFSSPILPQQLIQKLIAELKTTSRADLLKRYAGFLSDTKIDTIEAEQMAHLAIEICTEWQWL